MIRTLDERPSIVFDPPAAMRTAPGPAEQRGVPRDGVRLLVARRGEAVDTTFAALPRYLAPGDLVVVNNSATVLGEFDAELTGRGPVVVHLAGRLDDSIRVVEVRTAPHAARAVLDATEGDVITAGGVRLILHEPYPHASSPSGVGNRLWRAKVEGSLDALVARVGRPIAYGYLDRRYPLSAYQSVFATTPGSAEMPSAARPFTPAVVTELVSRGVALTPITLHTGVSSQEAGEGPQPEWFDVPASTAQRVNLTRASGGRVVAVGTTVTRALESAVDDDRVVARRGWTERVVTPLHPPTVVNGLITGWHDPQASHLLLVEAVAGTDLAQQAYDAAVARGYLWHEFGDSALLLP